MENQYLSFVSDRHLFTCIENLHASYNKAKADLSKKKFFRNKIDTIKLTFDTKFNGLSQEEVIAAEIRRQIDKSINNSIGTFHEEILGGIKGFEMGKLSGYDIKAVDDTLFADIKNKHNTMNSSAAESLFQKLARYADDYKKAKCYWVQILSKDSFCEKWYGDINGKEYSHSRVYKISGDRFYAMLTGEEDAFFQLYSILPQAIDDFLSNVNGEKSSQDSVISEIATDNQNRSLFDQITFESYGYYLGFDKL